MDRCIKTADIVLHEPWRKEARRLYDRSKKLRGRPNNLRLWIQPNQAAGTSRGIDRSEYYITVKKTVCQAMNLKARDKDAILRTVVLASVTNSYVEGSAGFTPVSGQTVRNHLKRQNPSGLLRMNDSVVARLRQAGALSKKCTLAAIDTHDIMYYGDPSAEGAIGTQPRVPTGPTGLEA